MSTMRELSPTAAATSDLLKALLPGLRAALEQEREFRVEQLTDLAADLRAHPTPAGTSGESAEERILREIAHTLASGARQALDSIERALHQMDTGEYGFCAPCGTPIPLTILRAIPQTTLCLGCRAPSESARHGAAEP
jgi:DnaK suppressor protein